MTATDRHMVHLSKILTMDDTEPNQLEAPSGQPLPAVNRNITEAKPQTVPREKVTAPPAQNPGLTLKSEQRRDGFDRFKDWVAAGVTLWK